MTSKTGRGSLLRTRGDGHGHVAFVELFFDLVFVFAITQLSHRLLAHPTPLGALETGILFLAVWWVWIFTSWVTNWLDPERTPVRVLLLVLMFAGLLMSSSLPTAFAGGGMAFALSYGAMQAGRSLFMMWALRKQTLDRRRNFQRISGWLSATALIWIGGAALEGEARLAVWGVAIALEYLSPSVGFWIPGLGRSATTDWDVEGGHMAERCALFIIIALGESILVTGATYAEHTPTLESLLAFAVSLAGSLAMWWIYFNKGAERGTLRITHSDDPGRLARIAYTYLHLPIVGGIVVSAVADEITLAHPLGETSGANAAFIIGGPASYVLGVALFKWIAFDRRHPPLSHLAALALLALLAVAGTHLPPLALSAATTALLILVATWEGCALRDRAAGDQAQTPRT